jgi:ParB family chromosome partitioning protein
MSSKNKGFAAGLSSSLDDESPAQELAPRLGVGALAGRTNRLAELASGALVSRAQELVDPARCRMWDEHNRDYAMLDEVRCQDLIESIKAQGRQEVPAIVRRVHNDPNFDFEVICGARRHWAISWLRAHNYPEFRFLVEIRDLTDEEAFRISDLENRARSDLSDIERARDYLRALARHYEGKQNAMADRLKVSEAWLSRYLDLARLPAELVLAFPDPHELKIKHVTLLKPLLKPDERKNQVLAKARGLAKKALEERPQHPQDVIRYLSGPAVAPKRSGKASVEVISSESGVPLLRIDAKKRQEVSVTLLFGKGGSRDDADAALRELLDAHWPKIKN